jgi:hypothetical protein
MRQPWLLIALAAAMPLVAGCSLVSQLLNSNSPGPPLLDGFDIVTGEPGGDVISRTVGIIADSHAHYLWGEPTLLQTNLADRLSPSAIRTPQGDLWGATMQAWFLEKAIPSRPIIHLGDAADIACIDEYTAFLTLMAARKQQDPTHPPWFQAPGNHDSNFYGNYYDFGDAWSRACSGHPLVKSMFVKWYLDALTSQTGGDGQPDIIPAALAPQLKALSGKIDIDVASFRPQPGMLASLAWSEATAPWKSFVVQELDLTAPRSERSVVAILLDTTVYDRPPVLVPFPGDINAGLTGDISDDEASIVRDWARAAHQKNAVVVLMGHHPYGALTGRGQQLLDELHQKYGAALYISAHDHSGKWSVDGQGSKVWAELNVGSLVDEPLEARTLRLSVRKNDGRIAVYSALNRLDDLVNQLGVEVPHCSRHDERWDDGPNTDDYYVSYRETGELAVSKTQRRILKVLIGAWKQYIDFAKRQPAWPAGWPTYQALDERLQSATKSTDVNVQIAALKDLARDTPPPPGLALRNYRICEGWWGTKYELMRRRDAATDDWGLVLPKE